MFTIFLILIKDLIKAFLPLSGGSLDYTVIECLGATRDVDQQTLWQDRGLVLNCDVNCSQKITLKDQVMMLNPSSITHDDIYFFG